MNRIGAASAIVILILILGGSAYLDDHFRMQDLIERV